MATHAADCRFLRLFERHQAAITPDGISIQLVMPSIEAATQDTYFSPIGIIGVDVLRLRTIFVRLSSAIAFGIVLECFAVCR